MTMTASQSSAFQATGGFAASSISNVFVGMVFVAIFLWGAWAIVTAYRGWANQRLDRGAFVSLCARITVIWLVLGYLLLH
ncbi:TIGR03758 family integrating conjugative element protein [Pseudomonas caricapapayae]|uniref:TIGR03758 family integrating conjugative element protein n=1 Tax=Pseudomonas caricapapayae TaxID=46678 RepID=UPI0029584D47|nr:TIGR03758 family integrating conjugative element protein [Pseudomonas caricapapayae]